MTNHPGIHANKDPLEKKFAIFRDDLSHMGEATVYRADSEAHYQFNNDFGRGMEALVTGLRSKFVSDMHRFPPLHSISFLYHQCYCFNANRLTKIMTIPL